MAGYGSPQSSPYRGRLIVCRVLMLDDTEQTFPIPVKGTGQTLFDTVIAKLRLVESDYFDLEYIDTESIPCWLDREKLVAKQIPSGDLYFRFLLKFYTPDPNMLEDEFTRYLFALQIKRDLMNGILVCQEHTAILLASFIVQAEVGNYCEEYQNASYISCLKLLPHQTPDVEYKIMEHHREHYGQTPMEADFNLLDTARKVEFYGIHLFPAQDHDGISLDLSVAHAGILVFQSNMKINAFSWAKIRKLCFKRRKFLIKLHPEGTNYYKDTVEFYFPSRNWSKNFWKRCIEHHAFFRCHTVQRVVRTKSRVVSRGSSFRYCGRTQKELVEHVRDHRVEPTLFERSTSIRTMSVINSRAGSPHMGTLNSHFTSGASSGSRTLERNPYDGPDRYLRSPDRNNSLMRSPAYGGGGWDGQPYRAVPPPTVDSWSLLRNGNDQSSNHRDLGALPASVRIDPSQFMLSKEPSRLRSYPVLSEAANMPTESTLPRSPELENIPDKINNTATVTPYTRPADHLNHSQSDTFRQPSLTSFGLRQDSSNYDEPTPPPPPIFEDDGPRNRGTLNRVLGLDTMATGTSKSTVSAASFTLASNASVFSSQTDESEEEGGRRKRFSMDAAYYTAKELLMTERTYKKDLQVIAVWFREAICRDDAMPDYLTELFFAAIVPMYEHHQQMLVEMEQRMSSWEGKSSVRLTDDFRRIGGFLLKNMNCILRWYSLHLEQHEQLLAQLESALKRHSEFERAYTDFESNKVCYLPLGTFLLKPIQRLIHYQQLLERLDKIYISEHPDVNDCQDCLNMINEVLFPRKEQVARLENWQKLVDLQQGLLGIDNLVHPSRHFIREGCLQKLSRKGFQQRMFFLFSDMLIYTSRMATSALQFKVHGQLMLKGMSVDDTDTTMAPSATNSFTVYTSNRCLVVAASSSEERDKWVNDLRQAIDLVAEQDTGPGAGSCRVLYPSLKSNSSSEALDDTLDDSRHSAVSASPEPGSMSSQPSGGMLQHRANMTMHVCWHRSLSVGVSEHSTAFRNQLSGYLLRKFKNSNGWQKLWVVFTNFCLFFYKHFQVMRILTAHCVEDLKNENLFTFRCDDFPLASLPLLGYSVGLPVSSDSIHKDNVFKLQFKNHVYFFRAESELMFRRWMEVLGSVTSPSSTIASVAANNRSNSLGAPALPSPPPRYHS